MRKDPERKLLSDPDKLRERLQELESASAHLASRGAHVDAMAECCFRIAVHPSTDQDEALGLLIRATRLDGSNPKIAYHIGRILLGQGRLRDAAVWLHFAHRLSPTSHRIWSHLSVLQRELDRSLAGSEGYQRESLHRRSRALARAVLDGLDELPDPALAGTGRDTPKTVERDEKNADIPPRPLLNSGRCRWSGAREILLEDVLERPVGQNHLEEMLLDLERVRDDAAFRSSGAFRFAALGIAWLAKGYPPSVIRRLLRGMHGDDSPAIELLRCVCVLAEADETLLPHLLSESLRRDEIPPLLASTIHHHRLLRRRMELEKYDAYRAARALLTTGAEGADKRGDHSITDCEKLLDAEFAVLKRNSLPELVDPAERPTGEEPDPLQKFERFSRLATELSQLIGRLKAYVGFGSATGTCLESRAAGASVAQTAGPLLAEAKTARSVFERLQSICGRYSINSFVGLCKEITESDGTLPDSFAERRRDCEQALRNLPRQRPLDQALSRIESMLSQVAGSSGPFRSVESQELAAIITDFDALESEYGDPPTSTGVMDGEGDPEGDSDKSLAGGDASGEPGEDFALGESTATRDPLAALTERVARIDQHIDDVVRSANGSFEAYSDDQLSLKPYRTLRASVLERQAEVRYRMGQRTTARALWSDSLSVRGVTPGALKNMAVCDTFGREPSRALTAWRAYLESLYAVDLALGTPRPHAAERSRCHQALAGSYAPAFLCKELKDISEATIDEEQVLSFMESPVRVKNFVNHKLLQFLNERLTATSPPVVLGATRHDPADVRESAAKDLLDFAETSLPLLPDRVRQGFGDLIIKHVAHSLDACESLEKLVADRDLHYQDDGTDLQKTLAHFAHLKFKLLLSLRHTPTIAEHMSRFESVEHLCRLDRLPLNSSRAWLDPVAGPLGRTSKGVSEMMTKEVRDEIVSRLLTFALSSDGSGSGDAARMRQYRRLVDEWAKSPVLSERVDFIDNPVSCYPAEVRRIFTQKDVSTELAGDVEALRSFVRRFPEITGPARRLAEVYAGAGQHEEAIQVLDQAIQNAFHVTAAVYCRCKRLEFRAHLCNESSDREEQRRLLRLIHDDAKHVKRNAPDEALADYADSWLKQCAKSGIR